jgi:hypothetical protein
MPNFVNNNYYLDIDSIMEKCKTGSTIVDENGKEVNEINIFKYELIKLMIERILDEFEDETEDDVLSSLKGKKGSLSFNLAFNTLYQYGIIKEEND